MVTRAPQILRELFDLVMPGRERLTILDLGCGTGLAGVAFKDVAALLDGVDLSPEMIEKARARKLYDNLIVGDIETALEQTGQYDLLLAARHARLSGRSGADIRGRFAVSEAWRVLSVYRRKQGWRRF